MKLKKPKFWDKSEPNLIAYLLNPFALLIQLIISILPRNKNKIKNIKTICVGNIYIGGTGKTSLALKLNKLLNEKKLKTCLIKKDYVNQKDEQNLLSNNGNLILNKDRSKALEEAQKNNYDVAIFDDGLQDRSINYEIKLICFNDLNWIGNGLTLPAGPLRESFSNLRNYKDIVINGNLENLDMIKSQLQKINPKLNIHLGKYIPININDFDLNKKYLAFSGIGNHLSFIHMMKKNGFDIIHHIEYPDHYEYNKNDLEEITSIAEKNECEIITTEKDILRIDKNLYQNIKYLRSELEILNEEILIKAVLGK